MGLEWPDYDGETLSVRRSHWMAYVGSTKTKASKASVPVIPPLLDEHRVRSGKIRPWAHPSRAQPLCGKPPKRPHAGLDYRPDPKLPDWRGWHAFRRGLATNLHAMGIDDKTIQAILRHENVATTQQAYIKTLPTAVNQAMDRYGDEVRRFVQ
jgi:integrase